jgi:hypothetical protein
MLEQQKTVLREQTVLGLLENYNQSPGGAARKLREYGVLFQSDSFLVLRIWCARATAVHGGNAMLSEPAPEPVAPDFAQCESELLGEAGMLAYPFRTGSYWASC